MRREWYRKQQQVMHKWSPYKGIAWHRGNQRWVVQRRGKTLGTCVSHGQALAHLCHGLGVQKSALMRQSSFPKRYALARWQMLIPICQDGLPGALSSAQAHTTHSRSMFDAMSALAIVSSMSKHGPYKDLLLQAWKSRSQGVQHNYSAMHWQSSSKHAGSMPSSAQTS